MCVNEDTGDLCFCFNIFFEKLLIKVFYFKKKKKKKALAQGLIDQTSYELLGTEEKEQHSAQDHLRTGIQIQK